MDGSACTISLMDIISPQQTITTNKASRNPRDEVSKIILSMWWLASDPIDHRKALSSATKAEAR